MATNVPCTHGVNVHSTVVGPPCPGHSMRMRLFGSTAFTSTGTEMPYISQSHWTRFPGSSRALPLVNQNFVVHRGRRGLRRHRRGTSAWGGSGLWVAFRRAVDGHGPAAGPSATSKSAEAEEPCFTQLIGCITAGPH